MNKIQIDTTLAEIRAALEAGQLQNAIEALTRMHPADRADAFENLDDDDQAAILPQLDIPVAADLLEELEDEEAADAAQVLSTDRLADVLDEMEPDEAADVLGDLPPERAAQALAEMQDAGEVRPLLGHPDETAGGLMTTWYIALRCRTTAAQAIEFLRHAELENGKSYYLYVIDRERRLVGVVGLRDLVIASPDTTMESIMNPNVVHAYTGDDQEKVAQTMARYDLTALPVVDADNVLQGVITHDDVIDVLEDEATEDVLHMGGVEAGPLSDRPYWSQRIIDVVRSRFVWLLVLFLAGTITGAVMRHYQYELETVVALSFFIPLLIGTGGNAGSQTVTTVIRALALQEVRRRDVFKVLVRELQAGALLGLLLGAVAFAYALLSGVHTEMAIAVAVAVLGICLWANTVASLIPLVADIVGVDPTVMSAPLISTLVDATGLIIYFTVATLVLVEI